MIPLTRMRRRSSLLLISLFAYLWSATSVGEALLIHQLAKHHNEATVVVPVDAGRELIFHHAGHQDAHEPTAIDVHAHADQPAAHAQTDDGHHGDHVVVLDNDQPASASLIKDVKFNNLLLTLPAISYVTSLSGTPLVTLALRPAPSTRNSALSTLKLTRLLI